MLVWVPPRIEGVKIRRGLTISLFFKVTLWTMNHDVYS